MQFSGREQLENMFIPALKSKTKIQQVFWFSVSCTLETLSLISSSAAMSPRQ